MSKIFEALFKSPNGEAASLPPAAAQPVDDLPVLGEAVAVAESPAPILQTDESGAIRLVSLRITGASPVLPFEDGPASEQYRIFRTKLLQHPRKPRMMVVSSAGPGDGKSITAINLAGVLALKGDLKVALVDADFRRSSVSNHLGLPDSPGLSEVLEGSADLCQAILRIQDLKSLFVIPAGRSKLNPAELLDSPRWTAVCARLRSMFDYIVLDSPPITAVTDYDLLAAPSDGVVVVVRPDHSNRQLCLAALESIPKNKCLGVVLNDVPNWFLQKHDYYKGYYLAHSK